MRILFIAEQLSAGGAEYYFLRKARSFKERGHDVFFASAGGPLDSQLHEAGIPHLILPSAAQFRPRVPYDEALADAIRLSRWMRRQGIEVVDALPIRPFLIAYPVARALAIPVFLECLSPTHFVPVRHAAWVLEVARQGRLFAMELDDAAGSCPRLGVDLSDVRVLPNPVDTRRFKPGPSALRLEIGAQPGDFIVMSASRLDADKISYVRLLLDDFAAMAAADRGVWLVIAGDGSEREALEADIAARGIPRVRLLGMRIDLERLYPGADVFVGMGTTVLEAAACGVAVVVANALSLRQGAVGPDEAAMCIFGHEGARTVGYRVAQANPATFRTFLEELKRDSALRASVGEAGRRLAVEIYGLDTVMGDWERAFEAAIGEAAIGEAAIGLALAGQACIGQAATPADRPRQPTSPAGDGRGQRATRVLFVTRPDALANPGGDTIQLLRTRDELERLGVEVELSFSTAPDARDFDLVHLFNLQLAGLARTQLQAIRGAGVPVAISTIYWDHEELDRVSPRIREVFSLPEALRAAILNEPVAGSAPGPLAELPAVNPRLAARRDLQRGAATAAELLLPNSQAEARVLRATLGHGIAPCQIVPNGIDPARFAQASPDAFVARFGCRDFVLSAARWDDRKNLLLLCEAMRGTGLPLVLAGARPNDHYAQLVRSALPPGTLVIDHLDQDELASAYAAARVHALPSWFETPGLSSLEAAVAGCAVVVGDRAAEFEYFGEGAYYCDPGSVASIRTAIACAWNNFEADRPRRQALRERILSEFTWEKAARRTVEAYEAVLGYPVVPAEPPGGIRPGGRGDRSVGPGSGQTGVWACGPGISGQVPARPHVQVLRLPDGPAFGPGVAQAALVAFADVLVLVSPEVVLDQDALARLVAPFASNPEIGAVGPVSDRGAVLQRVELFLAPDAINGRSDAEITAGLIQSGRGTVRADLLSRLCLALRCDVLDQIGGWDASLAPEHGELDISWRLREAGYRLAVASDVFVRFERGTAASACDPSYLRASADRLASKLERHHGRGRVPRPEALWGLATFHPTIDLWGPQPTRFVLVADGRTGPLHDRVKQAFEAAFGPDDPVSLGLEDTRELGPLEPSLLEPSHLEPGPLEPSLLEPSHLEPGPLEPSLLEPSHLELGPLEPSILEPSLRKSRTLELPGAGTDPAAVAAQAVAGGPSGHLERVVTLEPGLAVPGRDPARLTPALLRQIAGYSPAPLNLGVTSIVVMAVDQRDYTKLCLESLYERTREPFELILVDGGVGATARRAIENFRTRHPELIWLRPGGHASAGHLLNLGLAASLGKFVVVLKGDTALTDGWLTYLLAHLEAEPRVGLVGPRSNIGPGEQPIATSPYDGLAEMQDFARALAREQAGAARPVGVAGTFAMAMRRAVVEQVGGFDPAFPTGTLEAADFCLRSSLAGWDIHLAGDAYVHHFGLQPPAGPGGEAALALAFDHFRDKWGAVPDSADVAAIEAVGRHWHGRKSGSPRQLLPGRAGLPVVYAPMLVEGAKDRNLLFLTDWTDWSEDRGWEFTIRQYAVAFDGDSHVALWLAGTPEGALQRISGILEEAHPDGSTPDVLVLDGTGDLAALMALSQGVLLGRGRSEAEIRRLAEILRVPVLEKAHASDLRAWAKIELQIPRPLHVGIPAPGYLHDP